MNVTVVKEMRKESINGTTVLSETNKNIQFVVTKTITMLDTSSFLNIYLTL